jgi:hypothetical protein
MIECRIRRAIPAMAVFLALGGAVSIGLPVSTMPAAAQTAPAALSEQQSISGYSDVVAEIVQNKRESGVLSIRMRLRNTGDKDASVRLVKSNNFDQFYVVVGNKKYFVLRDSEKTPLATPVTTTTYDVDVKIPKGGSYVWYAKYPAPPAEAKKISYYTPLTPPFEDVPISD